MKDLNMNLKIELDKALVELKKHFLLIITLIKVFIGRFMPF